MHDVLIIPHYTCRKEFASHEFINFVFAFAIAIAVARLPICHFAVAAVVAVVVVVHESAFTSINLIQTVNRNLMIIIIISKGTHKTKRHVLILMSPADLMPNLSPFVARSPSYRNSHYAFTIYSRIYLSLTFAGLARLP